MHFSLNERERSSKEASQGELRGDRLTAKASGFAPPSIIATQDISAVRSRPVLSSWEMA